MRRTRTAETMIPILLLHGALDGPAAWDDVARALRAAGREVVVHDARDLIEPEVVAADALKLLPAHVVGHSRGGTAASWLAIEHAELVRSLSVIASPPQASEVFRAWFRKRLPRARNDAERRALTYLSTIPEDAFPEMQLRRFRGRALVVEYEDDPIYAPTHTLFWRGYLPYADFERVPGGHRAFAESADAAAWLAKRILAHVRAAETQ